jgi:hypothetical protein
MWQAIAGAETCDIGDGGRGWCRRESESDFIPITAATLAYWALKQETAQLQPVEIDRLRYTGYQ